MPSRSPASDDSADMALPDLPSDVLGDDESLYAPPRRAQRPDRRRTSQREGLEPQERPRQQRRVSEERQERPRRAPQRQNDLPSRLPRRPVGTLRQDRVIEEPRMQMQSATADIVTNIRPAHAARPIRARRTRNPAWSWRPVVMPQPRQILGQAWPNLLMAITAVLVLFSLAYMPFGLPLWAPLLMSTSLGLYLMSNSRIHSMWPRAAIVNLATVGAFFPMVIVRQSVLRVPFVEWGNGTLFLPIVSTIGVVIVLGVIALFSAILCEEDPEYAGILFLPAALLMPFFAGATEITSLTTALVVLVGIYVASSILTVVASMLPGAYPTLVAPIALALEFLVLPLSESSAIFPVGAGMFAKLLFFIVIFVAVGLTISVPVISVWSHQVRKLVQSGGGGVTRSRSASA